VDIDKVFPSTYLRASDLDGAVVPVIIDRLEQELVGRDKEIKPVLYFRGTTKGLILNKTNARKIVELLGEKDSDDWTGHRIALFAVDVEFQGSTVPAIRVKAAPHRNGGAPTATQASRPTTITAAPQTTAAVDSDDDPPF
jgi:hypothetical protein